MNSNDTPGNNSQAISPIKEVFMNSKILIVEDDIKNQKLLHRILTLEGYEVSAVADYDPAVSAIACNHFDLILSDVILENRTGIDLLRHMRKKNLNIPVVIITGYPTSEYASECIQLGAFDFMVKPLNKDDILRVVKMALGHNYIMDRQKQLESKLHDQKLFLENIDQDQTEFICRFKPDYLIIYKNKAFMSYFDNNTNSADKQGFNSKITDYDLGAMLNHLKCLSFENQVEEFEHQLQFSKGRRWVRWVVRAHYSSENQLSEFQAVGQDITERKLTESALMESQLKLEAVFQSIPEGIIAVDGRMNILQKNKSLDDVCRIATKVDEGMSLKNTFDTCPGKCMNVLANVLNTKKTVKEYNIECSHGDEKPKNLVLTCSAVADASGDFEGAVLVIRDITRISDLEKQVTERNAFQNIIGKSERMRHIYTLIGQLSDIESTVLITGESGTGKELIMEALHYGGTRSLKPLVRVNCSVLPENLLESELFGHVKGAFTGAVKDRIGRFEAADGGTIFLDEIGDISLMMQLKLLRAIERKEFERVGDNKTRKANVRIIAATNKDLVHCVQQGTFREDFYYRLKVLNIHLPPLSERKEDIPLLTDHFCHQFSTIFNKQFMGVSEEVMNIFLIYNWPGNVRELKHAIEHACILCPGGTITKQYLPSELEFAGRKKRSLPDSPSTDISATDLKTALDKAAGNKAMAARLLCISRSTLYRKLKALDT
jgi:DNA-binding NtrC family response regulator